MGTPKKKDNRGGARPNSGPKSATVSQSQLKEMREAAATRAEQEGKSLFDVCLDWIYNDALPIDRRMAAWKMYCDKHLIQIHEGGEADKTVGPAFYLPKKRPLAPVTDIKKK